MNRHKRIIGVAFLLFGLILSWATGSILRANPISGLTTEQQLGILGALFFGLLFIVAGYSLLANLKWAPKVCFPISIFALFMFPVGTGIGGYYLWYHHKLSRNDDT